MSTTDKPVPSLGELLADYPKNWGRWGPQDEVGALNYLGPENVLAALRVIRSGKVFTLQVPMANPQGDPIWPGARSKPVRVNVIDKGHFLSGKTPPAPGGIEGCDDMIHCYLQGSTQYDALGHAWFGDKIYNGYDAKTTIGGMTKASILPIAEKGIVGRAVLLDVARLRGKASLERGETFTHDDLLAAAAAQAVEIRKRDILLIHTGWIGLYFRDQQAFYGDGKGWLEPGLTLSRPLVDWFHEMEIPNIVTDTMANEVTVDPVTGTVLPLHVALLSYLGISFTEIAALDALADDCAQDGQYECFYAAAPLKVVQAAGSPVNPIVIK
jgi:kynurenine formamidase